MKKEGETFISNSIFSAKPIRERAITKVFMTG
jgi:hypothetical protein